MPSSRRPPLWLWLVAVPVVLFAIVWGALLVLLPPARATQLVRERLARSLAREVRFEAVSVSLWPPVRVSVKKVELAEPGGFEQGAAFSTAAVDLDLDVAALLSKRVKVRRLVLDRPAVHLLLRADGTTNFDSIGSAPARGAPSAPALDLDVREFRVHEGQLLLDDVAAARRTTLTLETRTSLSAEQGGTRIATAGETVISGLAFGPITAARASDLEQGLAKLRWTLQHRGKYDGKSNRLALEKLALQLGRTQLTVSGLVDSLGPRARYDLKARGDDLDVEQLLSWVSAADSRAVKGLSGHGRIAFDLGLRGSAAPGALPALNGRLSLQDAAFRYAGATAEVSALSFTANFRPDTLFVPDVKGMVAGQPLAARLLVWNLAAPMVDAALRGNIDLAAVAPLLAPGGTRLGGRAVVNLSARGPASDPGAMAVGGSAQLQNVSVEGAGLPTKLENVNGRVDFLPERATIQRLTARAGKSSLSIDANVARPLALMAAPGKVAPADVEFSFRSSYLDLAEILPTTPGAPFLPNASGGGHVSIDRLKQGKLDVTSVLADVTLEPAQLSSPKFSLQGYGGSVTGTARFDLRDTRKPGYAIKAQVDRVKAAALLAAWTPVRDLLVGTLSTTIDFSGAGQTPDDIKHTLTLVGLASLTDGRLGPGPALDAVAKFVRVPRLNQLDFAKLELPMRIEQGRLITDPVVLNGASGEWKLAGAIGFDGALDYAVSVTLPSEVVTALGARNALAAGALSDPQGRMLLDLHVSGTARSPRISWDTNAMRSRLAGKASEALSAQRDKLEAAARESARQALLRRFGAQQDSASKLIPRHPDHARDSIRAAARGLLKSFFGKGPGTPPAPPPPTPAPVPTAVPDSTPH